MTFSRALLLQTALFALVPVCLLRAQDQQSDQDKPTFRLNSNLVFLDVTVLDKKGRPVVTGLKQDDFTITEDKKPERIFSFEAPDSHVSDQKMPDDSTEGKAPVTIFVLDLLNSEFSDFAFIRYSVRRYLMAEPAQLAAPAELMVVGNDSLEMVQGFTRSRADLLDALDHLPPVLPYKRMNGSFMWERFGQSIDALQQIALQNRGISGRKNIVWVGHGGPNIDSDVVDTMLGWKDAKMIKSYVHSTANLLVDARITLFVIYPGLKVESTRGISLAASEADADIGETDPFAGDINFGVIVDETGGRLFYDRNDVDQLIKKSVRLGSLYYTLTYQPHDVPTDGKFRRIRVAVRDPNLRVMTKAGYFAPDKDTPTDPREQTMIHIVEAVQSTIPFSALGVGIGQVIRHPDTRTAALDVDISGKNLSWHTLDDGSKAASVLVDVASLDGVGRVLASRMDRVTIRMTGQDDARLASSVTPFKVNVRVPRKTANVRVAMESEEGGRIGTAVISRKALDAAPTAPSPTLSSSPQSTPTPPASK